jgi:hypothetical protein
VSHHNKNYYALILFSKMWKYRVIAAFYVMTLIPNFMKISLNGYKIIRRQGHYVHEQAMFPDEM